MPDQKALARACTQSRQPGGRSGRAGRFISINFVLAGFDGFSVDFQWNCVNPGGKSGDKESWVGRAGGSFRVKIFAALRAARGGRAGNPGAEIGHL